MTPYMPEDINLTINTLINKLNNAGYDVLLWLTPLCTAKFIDEL